MSENIIFVFGSFWGRFRVGIEDVREGQVHKRGRGSLRYGTFSRYKLSNSAGVPVMARVRILNSEDPGLLRRPQGRSVETGSAIGKGFEVAFAS